MRFDRLYTKLFCRPILLESSTRVGFELALLSLMQGNSFDQATLEFQGRKVDGDIAQRRSEKILDVRGDTATVHIDGTIDKNLSAMDRLCLSATDLNDVDAALATAGNDKSISNVMLVIDSPGGSVTGVPETGARIAALALKKNVFAFTEGMCCSAAFWLGSQCDQIFSTASAQMGSIGVYLALLDRSRQLEDLGVKVELIKDGKLKGAGAPFKPLTDDERAHFQDQVNQIGTEFRSAVNRKRPGVSMDTMQGQSFFGARNLALGLTDGIVSGLDEALAQF